MKKIEFTNSTGTKLVGLLEGDSKDKVVVLCHGFKTKKEGRSCTRLAELLPQSGISTFRFDFFGHGESEGEFADITISEGVSDILCALQLVQKQGFKKIGLFGNSFGGICALGAALEFPLASLALLCPVSDYKAHAERKFGKERIEKWKQEGIILYDIKEGKEFWLRYPFFEDTKKWIMYPKVNAITCPVIIVHGDADTTVPLEQSQMLVKKLPKAQLEVVPGADHRFTNPAHMENAMKLCAAFLKRNI